MSRALTLKELLTPAKAMIFRIVHRDNLPWILDNGLHCAKSSVLAPNYVQIGNPELIDKRQHHPVPCPPKGTLADYVPFYFTPCSPMLFNIKTGWRGIRKRENEEITIVVSSLHELADRKVAFVFTDRHALLRAARYTSELARVDWIDWASLQARDFARDESDKFERYEAETLVHKQMPSEAILGIGCYSETVAKDVRTMCADRKKGIQVVVRPGWYFS